MSEINPNDLPILDETIEDGDIVYMVMETEEDITIDFTADQRIGYESVSTNFTDESTIGVENSEVLFDDDVDIEIYLEGTAVEVL